MELMANRLTDETAISARMGGGLGRDGLISDAAKAPASPLPSRSMSMTERCARLLARMGAGEGIELQACGDDARRRRIIAELAVI